MHDWYTNITIYWYSTRDKFFVRLHAWRHLTGTEGNSMFVDPLLPMIPEAKETLAVSGPQNSQ
jgi:hypothetical protein